VKLLQPETQSRHVTAISALNMPMVLTSSEISGSAINFRLMAEQTYTIQYSITTYPVPIELKTQAGYMEEEFLEITPYPKAGDFRFLVFIAEDRCSCRDSRVVSECII
jgi:hypothetical protein